MPASARIDRDDVVALGLHVDRGEVAGPHGIGGEADHRDRLVVVSMRRRS